MQELGTVVINSKRDMWLTAVIVLTNVVVAVAIIQIFMRDSRFDAGKLVLPVLLVAAIAGSLWILGWTRYSITSSALLVQSGPFKWRVDVARIARVTPSHDPISSPALSLDRLRVEYTSNGTAKQLLVSPDDKERFIAALLERNPSIEVAR